MYYILQSFLAALALFVLVRVPGENKMVIISSIGATSFLVFAMPTAVSAQIKNVIGGHLVGLVCGTIFYFTKLPYFLEYPCVVGIAIFLMVALDVEHPPAAGTALAVVINELSPIDALCHHNDQRINFVTMPLFFKTLFERFSIACLQVSATLLVSHKAGPQT